jgi:uncharacterized protein YjbI with pentapeptide repeats
MNYNSPTETLQEREYKRLYLKASAERDEAIAKANKLGCTIEQLRQQLAKTTKQDLGKIPVHCNLCGADADFADLTQASKFLVEHDCKAQPPAAPAQGEPIEVTREAWLQSAQSVQWKGWNWRKYQVAIVRQNHHISKLEAARERE